MRQEIENELYKNTKKHCAALFWAWSFGKMYFRNKDEDYIEKQGTLTFIEYKDNCYAITNRHVIEPEEDDNWKELLKVKSLMVSLDKHMFFGIHPIFLSPRTSELTPLYPPHFPKDIAIFPFSTNRPKLEQANKAPVPLPDTLPKIQCDDLVLVVGFPGGERKIISGKTYGHRLAHIIGTVVSITENSIQIFDQNPKRDKDISIGGMSRGPIFKFDYNTGDYVFAGIIHQGDGNKRRNAMGQEEIRDNIWIFGYPLDGERLEEMLNSNYALRY